MPRAKSTPVLTDMQKRYEAETGNKIFSQPKSKSGGRNPQRRSSEKKAYGEWAKTTSGMDAGKNRFNEMMANRSQNPVLGQTQSGMSGFDKFQTMQAARDGIKSDPKGSPLPGGFYSDVANLVLGGRTPRADNRQAGYDKFQAMQAARNSAGSTYNQNPGMEALSNALAAKGDPRSVFSNSVENYRNRNSGQPAGYDKFQAMQAARDNTKYTFNNPFKGLLSGIDMSSGPFQDKMQANAARQRSEQGARFNAAMGANPLVLQQLQMGQRQMGPQFNAFGFGSQPGLAAQGGQGGSMLANMSSQGMNQLAAGQQNNPTIFKAKS